jgi:3-methyladenine DNA glycosylase AlkC
LNFILPVSPPLYPTRSTESPCITEVKMSEFTAEVTKEIPSYPELTPGFDNKTGSYWPNLSTQNAAALSQIEKWFSEHSDYSITDLAIQCLDPKLIYLRYLRANNFDIKKTTAHIEKNIAWRKEWKVKELVTVTPEAILGNPMEELTKVFPHWHYGYDKTGRPVVYKQYGKFDASHVKTLSGGNYDNIVKYHVWEQEAASRLCLKQTEKTGKLVETVSGIVDVKDMRLFQITRDFLAMTKLLADVDQGQYPETLGRIYIINTPSAFPLVWRVVKPWLDPIVTSKIFILGGPKDYEPALIDFIGKENLPINYGGDLPSLDYSIHPYHETMTTEYHADAKLQNVDEVPMKRGESNNSTEENSTLNGSQNSDKDTLDADAIEFASGL